VCWSPDIGGAAVETIGQQRGSALGYEQLALQVMKEWRLQRHTRSMALAVRDGRDRRRLPANVAAGRVGV
jgi:hypothetical protein